MKRSALFVLIPLAVACTTDAPPWAADPLAEPQAISLLGDSLYARPDTTGAVAAADSALADAPNDVERLIAAGRIRRNVWQYRQAMALYTRAMELAPDDWRPYRFRGHRFISVREFDRAIDDLERARDLAPGNWDVAYHLGLAYYLAGRYEDAADTYVACLEARNDPGTSTVRDEGFRGCEQNAEDPESRVAMVEWAVRALRRADRAVEVATWLASVPEDLPIEENVAYYHTLQFYQGKRSLDDLLAETHADPPRYRLETIGYGVGNWLLLEGDSVRALEILEQVADDAWWPGFGRIAAEVVLAGRRAQ